MWEGDDDKFEGYVHSAFGVPTTLIAIVITPRTERARCAVSIGSDGGRIAFVLSYDYAAKKLATTVLHLGPMVKQPGDHAPRGTRGEGSRHCDGVVIAPRAGAWKVDDAGTPRPAGSIDSA